MFCLKEGEIYTRKGLDREKKSQYVFTVMLEEKRPSTKIVSGLILRETLFDDFLSILLLPLFIDGQRSDS